MVDRFEIGPIGPFSLASSARFFESFAPATYGGIGEDLLRFAFVSDGLADGDRVAGVLVHQEDDVVIGEVYGNADVEAVKRRRSAGYSCSTWTDEVPWRLRSVTRSSAGCSGATPV